MTHNALECTEPTKWQKTPGPKASDQEIDEYLQHLKVCPFHAQKEAEDEKVIKKILLAFI